MIPEKVEAKMNPEEVVGYEPKDEEESESPSSTKDYISMPEKKVKVPKKTDGAPKKIGSRLKSFYPKLKRLLKKKCPIGPNFNICNKNIMKMMDLYDHVLQPHLIKLSKYDPLAKRPTTDK